MKRVFAILVVLAVCLLLKGAAFADGEEPVPGETSVVQPQAEEFSSSVMQNEISVLITEIEELQEIVAALQSDQSEPKLSIGVMPIENAWKISQVGDSFREILISALNEGGVSATESLDEETLNSVRRQDQLVREGWLDPGSSPRRGQLQGVTHFLFATVTQYEEKWSNEESVGFLTVRYDDCRVRTGFLSIDFRLVDASSGIIVDAFQKEMTVKERTGPVLFDSSFDPRPVSEIACRSVAEQAAERISGLLNPEQAPTEQQN